MVLFLVTQIKLGKLTLEQVRDNPKLSKYYAAVAAELEGANGS